MELARLDLAPGNSLRGCCTGETTPVWRICRNLDKVIVSTLLNTENFPQLRLGLKIKVLGTAATENKHTIARSRKHNRRRLIHIGQRIERQQASIQRIASNVHPNRRIAWR